MIDIDRHLSKIEQVEKATWEVMREVLIEITPTVTSFVRTLIERKYNAAGMGKGSKYYKPTNKMIGAIRDISVRINMFGKRPSIVYSLPAGIAPYEGSDAPFYQVFMGQSYGSVRGATGANKKNKKGLKNLALKGKDGISGRYQKTGRLLRYSDAQGNIKMGNIVVTEPKRF